MVRIKHILSNLTSNNLFILFNHWDEVCSGGDASEVRGQHLVKSRKFLVDEFGFEEESVKNSIFFVSAKEVLAIHRETANVVGEGESLCILYITSTVPTCKYPLYSHFVM